MTTYPQKITFGEMRASGVRDVLVYCRDHRPDVSAALTTVAFDQSGPRWLGISDLIAEPEGPTFISYKVARSRLDRLRFVTQDPLRKWSVLRARAVNLRIVPWPLLDARRLPTFN